MSHQPALRAWRLAAALWLLAAQALFPAYGLDDSSRKLLIGMTTPLTGPAATYGVELELGVRLGLAEVNTHGGVAGRRLELLARDDAADPKRALLNARALADAGVMAITGAHGDAAIDALLAWAATTDVPLIGLASGAETLRDPPQKNVFNLRAGVREEAAAIVLHLDTIGITEIVAIAQDDAMGRTALAGVQLELARLAMRPQMLLTVRPDPTESEIRRTVETACKRPPQAFVLALDARNALPTIRAVRAAGCATQIYVMSECGSRIASPELAGVVVSQVLPSPWAGTSSVVLDFRRLLAEAQPAQLPSYPVFEGYLYARLVAEALRRCAEPSRRCLTSALEAKPLQVGGYQVQFSTADRRGSRFVEMTIVTAAGKFRR